MAIVRWAAIALLTVLGTVPLRAGGCNESSVSLRGAWGQARFNVEIADNAAERARGLMYRESLPKSAGMLFVYDKPAPVAFWMKNTLIPLDLIFMDQSGIVRRVHHGAIPGDLTRIKGGQAVLAVLEINAGLARAMGISEGSEMRHPAFGEAAAWPCD